MELNQLNKLLLMRLLGEMNKSLDESFNGEGLWEMTYYESKSGHPIRICPGITILEFAKLGGHRGKYRYPLTVTLCHWKMESWSRSHHRDSSIHLFGHHHGRRRGTDRSVDVGVDAWNFSPVSLKMLLEYFSIPI